MTGVLAGVALSGLKLLLAFSRLDIRVETDGPRRRTVLTLVGAATFLRLPRLAAVLAGVPAEHTLHVPLDRLTSIDHACLDLLTTWADQHAAHGGRLVLDWEALHAKFNAPQARG